MEKLTFSDWISLIGLVITLLGFIFTIFQLIKTEKAAIAAKKTAIDTRKSIEKVNSLISIHEITNLSKLVIQSLKSKRISDSIIYIDYMREKISSAKVKYQMSNEINDDILSKLDKNLNKIIEIHNFLLRSNSIQKTDISRFNDFTIDISDVRDSLSEILESNISIVLSEREGKNVNS